MPKSIALLGPNDIALSKTLLPAEFGESTGKWSVTTATLRGGLREGVEIITVDNESTRFVVVPTRGLSIWKAWRGDLEVGWKSPVRGPAHPTYVDLGEPSGLGWLDGFDELFVRCGLVSNGAPEHDPETGKLFYPLHGRIANKPAQEVSVAFDAATKTISVTGVVEETRFHFTKLRMRSTISTQLGSGTIAVKDEVENFSGSPAEIQMLYHVNFGLPLLDGGSCNVLPFKTLVPRNEHAAAGIAGWDHYLAPQAGYAEQVYFFNLYADASGRTRSLLKNAHGTQGASLVFNARQLPCYSLWKNTTGESDGYVTGLEPGTNYPNPRSYEGQQGRVVKLAAGGKTSFDIALEIHATAAEVAQAEKDVQKLLNGQPQTIHKTPQEGWCAP